MDYTTLARVKLEIHASLNYDDALLSKLVTAASRAWDRKCTGVPDSVNYFATETVVNEKLEGWIDRTGNNILCYPHKPIVTSVTALTFQQNIVEQLYTADVARVDANGPQVRVYPTSLALPFPGKCRVFISYVGGLGLTVDDLPDDMQEMVAILAARFYREAETGLSDQMGVAEMAQMAYTKAWPVRVTDQMGPYIRRVGWRHVA